MAETLERTTAQRSPDALIQLSELAAEKVREFMAADGVSVESTGLRISVLPGGCSGFEYGLELEDEIREDDIVFECHGIRMVVDPFSAQYLKGVAIGYASTFQGSGFTFENPNATGSCGCGTSFAV